MSLRLSSLRRHLAAALLLSAATTSLRAQDPRSIVREAVSTELRTNRDDHTRWRYRDEEREKGTVSIVVQTDTGSVKRLIERAGQPLSSADAATEDQRVQNLIHDTSRLEKQRHDSNSDDRQAEQFLNMLPDAFTWKIERETPESFILHFEPDPNFHAPDIEARVLGSMNGTLIVDKAQHRIRTISGKLTQDVTIGFGIFGRLKQGGTFDVERRQVAPGLWQITETHVHIDGKALFFKSIGQQQDEIQTDFHQVPGTTSLAEAAELSKPGH